MNMENPQVGFKIISRPYDLMEYQCPKCKAYDLNEGDGDLLLAPHERKNVVAEF